MKTSRETLTLSGCSSVGVVAFN